MEAFERYLIRENLSANTVVAYMGTVRQYHACYSQVNIKNLGAYKKHLIRTYCTATVNQKICAINRYMRFMEETEEMDHYRLPVVRIQNKNYAERVISDKDYKRLKKGLKRDGNMSGYFLIWFLAGTGARISELLKIRVENLKEGYMDTYTKGGKIRRIYIPRVLCKEALEWCGERQQKSGFFFLNENHKHITDRGVRWKLKQLAAQYRIEPEFMYPHSFRHRFAQNFLQRFNDISLLADLLGHESIETTRLYLVKSSKEQKRLIDQKVLW